MPNDREKLLKELKRMDDGYIDLTYNRIADFIIDREKSLAKEIVKPLERECIENKIGKMYYSQYLEEGNVYCKAISESLTVASKIINGG